MNNKLSLKFALLIGLSLFVFSSCDDDDDNNPANPTVAITELGSGHDSPTDKTGYIGGSIHLEAEIEAPALVKQIDVEIHQEDGGSYKIEKTYTDSKYVGVKNTTLHEHIDIPADAIAGDYHLHLTVTDQLGQTTTVESELSIVAGAHDDDDHDH